MSPLSVVPSSWVPKWHFKGKSDQAISLLKTSRDFPSLSSPRYLHSLSPLFIWMSPYQRGLLWHPIEESPSCPISLYLLYQVLCFFLHALTPSDSLSLYYNWEKNKEQLCFPHHYYHGSVCGGKTKIPFAGIYIGFYTYVYWERPWQILESRAWQSPKKE